MQCNSSPTRRNGECLWRNYAVQPILDTDNWLKFVFHPLAELKRNVLRFDFFFSLFSSVLLCVCSASTLAMFVSFSCMGHAACECYRRKLRGSPVEHTRTESLFCCNRTVMFHRPNSVSDIDWYVYNTQLRVLIYVRIALHHSPSLLSCCVWDSLCMCLCNGRCTIFANKWSECMLGISTQKRTTTEKTNTEHDSLHSAGIIIFPIECLRHACIACIRACCLLLTQPTHDTQNNNNNTEKEIYNIRILYGEWNGQGVTHTETYSVSRHYILCIPNDRLSCEMRI